MTNRDLIMCHCFIYQENIFVKSLKTTNALTVVSKLLFSLGQKEWIIVNLKISCAEWDPNMEILSVRW